MSESNEDEDKTVLGPGDGGNRFESGNALPVGTRIGEFEITGHVGEGGFGIVYKAYDHSLQRKVALKEYLPSSLAERRADMTVRVKSPRHEDPFAAGLRSFVNEARTLAQFDHPSLVKVFRFWEQHGTAYMVMPLYEGQTLKQALKGRGTPPDERWLRSVLDPLLEALEVIHRANVFHRDIAPDNILLLGDGRPVLLDFGAARRVIGDMTRALTVILKPGYAPIEQYDEDAQLRQGPWTDLYALAGVMHYAMTGKPPPAAVGRSVHESYQPLGKRAAGRYSAHFLSALDRALALMPDQRPQSVAEFRALLGPPPGQETGGKQKARWPIAAGAAVFAVALASGVGYYLVRAQREPPPVPVAKVEEPKRAEPPAPPKTPPEIPPVVEIRLFDPSAILSDLFAARDPSHAVTAEATRKTVRVGKDQVQFRVRSSEPGYVYVLLVGTGHEHFTMLFPNKLDQNNRIGAKAELVLPRPHWALAAQGPAGINTFLVIVSPRPRDFSSTGLKTGDVFAEFDPAEARRAFDAAGGSAAPFAGTPKCPEAPADCSSAYGAALFTIEEVT